MKKALCVCAKLLLKSAIQIVLAGGLYFACETVFRCFRHHNAPSLHVFFLGGFAFFLCILLCRIPLRGVKRFLLLPPLGAAILTAYEYFFGLYFLVTQNLRIWNYSGCPHEYRGLICLQFSFCWIGAMLLAMLIDALTERALRKTAFSYRALLGIA